VSVLTAVFADALPPLDSWQETARELGHALTFSPKFDPSAHRGGAVRVECDGFDAAFEFYVDDVELEDELQPRVAQYAHNYGFVTHSRTDDRYAAIVAAAALCRATSGLLYDDDFVDTANVETWMTQHLRYHTPKTRPNYDAVSAAVLRVVDDIASSRGFVSDGGKRERWYTRPGTDERVLAEMAFDADESFLSIDFFRGDDGGRNLSDYLFYRYSESPLRRLLRFLTRRPILPKNIEVDEDFADSPSAGILRRNFIEADATIWKETNK